VTTPRYRSGARSSASDEGGLFGWFTALWRREPPAYRVDRDYRRKPVRTKRRSGWIFSATAPDYGRCGGDGRGSRGRGCDDDNQQQCCITHCEPCQTALAPLGNGAVGPVVLDPVTGAPLQGPVTYVYTE
jgi:hypothetical protein